MSKTSRSNCIARRSLALAMTLAVLALATAIASAKSTRPNFIVVFCDNLGYGDVGCFGSTHHRTPNLDQMAAEGMRLTSFYSTSGVCTPSRASLLTGCYPRRVGLDRTEPDGAVLRPVSPNGLNPSEVTVAEVLKKAGYHTACIGKWHLGDQLEFLPTRQGFDSYYGIPYSDDMTPRAGRNWPPLPLLRNERVIEAPTDRNLLTRRLTEEAVRIIRDPTVRPFFIYLAQAMPGSTQRPFASEPFQGRSANGPYGDSVEELDWSMGRILDAVHGAGLTDHTLIIWTSDNGAPRRNPPQGSNAPFSGWGYSTAEGGMRVPCIAWWPGRVPAHSTCTELTTTMDLLPTLAHLGNTPAPSDRTIDGHDIWPLLAGQPAARSPYDAFYYYYMDQLQAIRCGRWKLYLALTAQRTNLQGATRPSAARLYDLNTDPMEKHNLIAENPIVVARMTALADKARTDLGEGARRGRGQRPVGHLEHPRPLTLANSQ